MNSVTPQFRARKCRVSFRGFTCAVWRANDVELAVDEADESVRHEESSNHSSMTTPRLVLPPSEHLQTIDEKSGNDEAEQAELKVPTTVQNR